MTSRRGRWLCAVASAALAAALGGTRGEAATVAATASASATSPQPGTAEETRGGAAATIGRAKQARLVVAANTWLQRYRMPPACRFDVVAIDGGTLAWLRNAIAG